MACRRRAGARICLASSITEPRTPEPVASTKCSRTPMRLPRKSAIEKSKRCSEERLIHASGGELLYLSNSDAVPAGLGMAGIIEAPDGPKDTRCDPPHPRWG